MTEGARRFPPRWLLGPAVVAIASFLAHSRALDGELLGWDDKRALMDFTGWRGLSWASVEWAFTSTDMAMYRPLTWLSYALDFQLHGLSPWGYHLTNVLLHAALGAALAVLIQHWLRVIAPDRSGRWMAPAAALLFTLHPLRVQAVAWVSARADVLAALLLVLASIAWLRWVSRRSRSARWLWHGLFVASLLAKPIALGAPLAWWAAQHWLKKQAHTPQAGADAHADLALGLAGSLAGAFAALIAKGAWSSDDLSGLPSLPPEACFLALHNLVFPLWKTLWPSQLGYYEPAYPFDPWIPQYVLGAVAAAGLAALIWRLRLRQRGLALSALAYVVLIAPTLGVVPFGYEVTADRFNYLPALTWSIGLAPLLARADALWPSSRLLALRGTMAAWLCAMAVLSARQTSHWKSSRAFWEHNLAINPHSGMAHTGMGDAMLREDRLEAARAYYLRARELQPEYEPTLLGLGFIDLAQARPAEAIEKLEIYLLTHPENRPARTFIMHAYAAVGRTRDAAAVQFMLEHEAGVQGTEAASP